MKNQADMKNTGTPPCKAFCMAAIKEWFKPAFALLVLVLLGSHITMGQVGVQGISSSTTVLQNNTISYTVPSVSNGMLLVMISHTERTVSTITYGDDPLDLIVDNLSDNRARTAIYKMLNPPAGTANLVVNFSGANDRGCIIGIVTLSNVDQNNPTPYSNSTYLQTASPSLSVTSVSGQLVLDVIASNKDVLSSPGASQTQTWNTSSGSEPTYGGASYKTATSTSTTMSWTKTGTNNRWSMSLVAVTPVPVIDLGIAKSVNNSTPYIGQTITFTLTVTSSGTGSSANTVVNDLLPAGYTYQSHSTVTGTYNGGTGVWDIGTLNAGSSATLTISAVVNASGSYTNTATISGDVQDNNAGNNSASAGITACQAGGTAPLFNNLRSE